MISRYAFAAAIAPMVGAGVSAEERVAPAVDPGSPPTAVATKSYAAAIRACIRPHIRVRGASGHTGLGVRTVRS
jgi:hypothetical protein